MNAPPPGGAAPLRLAEVLRPSTPRQLRRLPRLVLGAVRVVWRAAPHELLRTLALQVVAGAALAGQLLAARRLLATVLQAGTSADLEGMLPTVATLGVLTAVVGFANAARNEQQHVLAELTARHAMREVIDVATGVDLLAYEEPDFHNRLQRATLNAQLRPAQAVTGLVGLAGTLVAMAGLAVALLLLHPAFLGLVLLGYVPVWLATARAGRAGHRFTVEQTERDRRRAHLAMVLAGKDAAGEIRSNGAAAYLQRRYDALYQQRIADLRKVTARRVRLGAIGAILTAALTATVVGVLVWFVTSGRFNVASATAAAAAMVLLGQRLQPLSAAVGALFESSLFIEDFLSFVELRAALPHAGAGVAPPPGFRRLEARAVWFSYPSARQPVLRDVSLHVDAGEIVALVGENGSGKSTLAKVLAGLYAPTEGCVTWDGDDISQWEPAGVRAHVAVMFQDFVRYQLSAGDNIVVGRPEAEADAARMIDAAQRAGADDFLAGLPEGYGTQLGPQFLGGVDLSTGQWQRVALARAFFRDAPFVILDEPAAALDPRAEAALFDGIRTLCAGRAVLLISHRYSSVRSADRIYVLHDGEIVESGSHDTLVAAGGLYADLFSLQARGYGRGGAQPGPDRDADRRLLPPS